MPAGSPGPAAHALCSPTGGDCLCCSQTCVCPACVRAQAFRLIRLFFDPKGCNALFPSSRGSSCPRDWTHVSCGSWIAGRFLTADPPGTPWVLRSYPCKLHSLSKNGVSAEKFCISRPVCLWTQLWCKGGGPWGQSREQNSPESLFFLELVFPASLGLGDSLFFPKGSALGRLWCAGPAVGTSLTPFQAQSPGLWPRGGEEPLPCRKELGSLLPLPLLRLWDDLPPRLCPTVEGGNCSRRTRGREGNLTSDQVRWCLYSFGICFCVLRLNIYIVKFIFFFFSAHFCTFWQGWRVPSLHTLKSTSSPPQYPSRSPRQPPACSPALWSGLLQKAVKWTLSVGSPSLGLSHLSGCADESPQAAGGWGQWVLLYLAEWFSIVRMSHSLHVPQLKGPCASCCQQRWLCWCLKYEHMLGPGGHCPQPGPPFSSWNICQQS